MFTKQSRAANRSFNEWQRAVRYDLESRRRLEIAAVQPYVGALAVVSRFAGHEVRVARSSGERDRRLQSKAGEIATALSVGLGKDAKQYTVQHIETGHPYATPIFTETDWLTISLEGRDKSVDTAQTYNPDIFEDYPPHPALNALSDKYREKFGKYLEKRAGDRPIHTSHLAYGAERVGATAESPYVAIASFVGADIAGIDDPRSAVGGSVHVLAHADADGGQISWDRITMPSDLHR